MLAFGASERITMVSRDRRSDDPTIMGWVTVAAYFLTALICFLAGRRNAREKSIWWVFGFVLIVLGVNKQLDLQSWFTQVARDLARSNGWYENRAILQQNFIAGLVGFGLIGSVFLLWMTRRRPATVRLGVVGLVMLVAFIAVRAASFHHVDLMLRSAIFGIRFNWLLELGGIAIIASAAVRAETKRKR